MENTGKIGLIIEVISEGERKTYTSASAENWAQIYFDVRSYIQKIGSNDDSSFVDFVCYHDNVALYCVCRSIPGRPGDAICGMITIPSDVEISGNELDNIINQTKKELAKSSQDSKFLDELFDKDYSLKTERSKCHNSADCKHFAYQKYGKSCDYELYELLDKNLFSSCYNTFKAVFLIKDSDNIVPEEDVVKLEQDKIEKYAIIKYPENCGCSLFIGNQEFTSDYAAERGNTVNINVKRNGYIPQDIRVAVDRQYVDIASDIKKLEWELSISRNLFYVVDKESQEYLENSIVKIDDKEIKNNVAVPEASLHKAIVKIECNGYKSAQYNLADIVSKTGAKNRIKIKLTKLPETYTYIITDSRLDDSITFSVENVKYDVNTSPIDRYEVRRVKHDANGKRIYLQKRPFFTFKNIVTALGIIAVILGLGFWGGVKLADSKPASDKIDPNELAVDIITGLNLGQFNYIENKYELENNTEFEQLRKRLIPPPSQNMKLPENQTGESSESTPGDQARTPNPEIQNLLSNSNWIREKFRSAGYEDLFIAVNSLDFDKIIKINDTTISPLGIDVTAGNKYLSWRRVLALSKLKPDIKDIVKAGELKQACDTINLTTWLRTIVLCRKDSWKRQEFLAIGLEKAYTALSKYDYDNFKKYITYIDTTSSEEAKWTNNVIKQLKKQPNMEKPTLTDTGKNISIKKWREPFSVKDNGTDNNGKLASFKEDQQ